MCSDVCMFVWARVRSLEPRLSGTPLENNGFPPLLIPKWNVPIINSCMCVFLCVAILPRGQSRRLVSSAVCSFSAALSILPEAASNTVCRQLFHFLRGATWRTCVPTLFVHGRSGYVLYRDCKRVKVET